MNDRIYLVGSETVQNASHQMKFAADEMIRAANAMHYAFETEQRRRDEWLQDFERILREDREARS